MVAFRVLTQELIAQQLTGTINGHERSVWEFMVSLGNDPRVTNLGFTVSDEEDSAQVSAADYVHRLKNAYTMAGISEPVYGETMTSQQKIDATEAGLLRIEELAASRCAELGVDPGDLVEGWTAAEGQEELDVLLALMLNANAILDALAV